MDQPYAFGSALTWMPYMALARQFGPLNEVGDPLQGYEWFFVRGVGMTSILVVLTAFLLIAWVLRETTGSVRAATLTLMMTTPLLFYQFQDPFYSHAASALATTLVMVVWWRNQDKVEANWPAVLLGICIGLTALVRWQNAIYVVLPGVTALLHVWEKRANRALLLRQGVSYLLAVGLAALAVFSIQFNIFRLFFGDWLTIPQGNSFMDFRGFWLKPVLFSTFRGLVPWMPVALPAIVGLLLNIKKRKAIAVPLLMMLLLSVYVNASTRDWFAGGGYGPRRFSSELMIFVVGYTWFLDWLKPQVKRFVAPILGAVLGWHQLILLRYGLPEKIGGRVRSMAPDFLWEDGGYVKFLAELGRFSQNVWLAPRDLFVFGGTPLDLWLRSDPLLRFHGWGFLWATLVWIGVCGLVWVVGWLLGRVSLQFRIIIILLVITLIHIWVFQAA